MSRLGASAGYQGKLKTEQWTRSGRVPLMPRRQQPLLCGHARIQVDPQQATECDQSRSSSRRQLANLKQKSIRTG